MDSGQWMTDNTQAEILILKLATEIYFYAIIHRSGITL